MQDACGPFSVIRLHRFDARCWAVVDANGAIALNDGKLLMRLTKAEADELAAENNRPPLSWAPVELLADYRLSASAPS